jgi:hypothetical protein
MATCIPTTNEIFNLSADDLQILIQRVRRAQEMKRQMAKADFRIGQTIYFEDKYGRPVEAELTKICRKNFKARQYNPENGLYINWTVSPNLVRSQK